MRIITGSARGIVLNTLEGENTRPTESKIKEAIFSSIQFDLTESLFLDLFAGSGQMGLEAVSRGAKKSVFVDASKEATTIIMENAKKTKLYPKTDILTMDWEAYLKSAAKRYKFDFVFIDPPYSLKLIPNVLKEVYDKELIKSSSLLICEDDAPIDIEGSPVLNERYSLAKCVRYGKIFVSYLHPKMED